MAGLAVNPSLGAWLGIHASHIPSTLYRLAPLLKSCATEKYLQGNVLSVCNFQFMRFRNPFTPNRRSSLVH